LSEAKLFDTEPLEKTCDHTGIISPNTSVKPVSAGINEKGHLTIGGLDTVDLAEQYGTPLWIIDEATIRASVAACKAGLEEYPNAQITFAGKAFLCLAMCHLIKQLGVGLDVVSEGEMYTAIKAEFPSERLVLHGNNKSPREIEMALSYGDVRIVIDNRSELEMVAAIARKLGRQAKILLRLIPGVEPGTHKHNRTGHDESKFGIPIVEVPSFIDYIAKYPLEFKLLGLHMHLGSIVASMDPYNEAIRVVTDLMKNLKAERNLEISELDLGGGLAISYLENEEVVPIFGWSQKLAFATMAALGGRGLVAPKLILEPGRSIVGTSGVTIYRVGHAKELPNGLKYIAVDGGMADNPRPITYQAKYTTAIANRMNSERPTTPVTLAGKYCEQGDIIVEETYIAAKTGDLVAVFGTGAYNYSQSSNYNRTGRPACVLVANGEAEVIVERESNEDLLRNDRVPPRLLKG
jgi:diaminopimelate decarboxylase